MSDWCPPELCDVLEVADFSAGVVEAVNLPSKKSLEKTQSEKLPKTVWPHQLDARLTKSEGFETPLLGVGFKEKAKKAPPKILEMGIREQLRLAGFW